jgi:NAD(P)-dependent dehydrogenase (short-subunit alcohol dehydrogenase family)
LHLLILNAGVMKSPGAEFIGKPMKYGFETTQDGVEYHIGVNHVAHFHLTQLLMQKLQESAPSRVVVVSSLAEQGSYAQGMVFEDWIPENGQMPANYEDGNAYGQSKLANLLFAKSLAARNEGTNVTAYSLHPGVIHTDLSRYMNPIVQEQLNEQPWLQRIASTAFFGIFQLAMMDAKTGAYTQLHVATADVDTLVNGAFYHPIGKVARSNHPQGENKTLQTMLWQETERVIAKLRDGASTSSA